MYLIFTTDTWRRCSGKIVNHKQLVEKHSLILHYSLFLSMKKKYKIKKNAEKHIQVPTVSLMKVST